MNPIVFVGLTLDQANATALYHSHLGASVHVTSDGTGLFKVEVLYPSTGTGPAEPGDGTGSGGGPQGGGEEVAWGKKVSAAFKAKVIAISSGLGCDPNYLMAAMAFETGASFSPSIRNPHSGRQG
jgi:hypothetical protein